MPKKIPESLQGSIDAAKRTLRNIGLVFQNDVDVEYPITEAKNVTHPLGHYANNLNILILSLESFYYSNSKFADAGPMSSALGAIALSLSPEELDKLLFSPECAVDLLLFDWLTNLFSAAYRWEEDDSWFASSRSLWAEFESSVPSDVSKEELVEYLVVELKYRYLERLYDAEENKEKVTLDHVETPNYQLIRSKLGLSARRQSTEELGDAANNLIERCVHLAEKRLERNIYNEHKKELVTKVLARANFLRTDAKYLRFDHITRQFVVLEI